MPFLRASLSLAVATMMIAGLALAKRNGVPEGDQMTCGPQHCLAGQTLRESYAGPVETWPTPWGEPGIPILEMAAVSRQAPRRGTPAARLGERLFHDPRLSGSGQISCASCHSPELAFTDRVRTSFGHNRQRTRRNAPTLLDKADQPLFHWDGQAASLEEQALLPILDPGEMAGERADIEAWLNADPDYRAFFAEAFGPLDQIRLEDVARALAAFQRTLHQTTDFDRFMSGERDRLDDQQILGLHLFRTTARCMSCHMGPRLTDDRFHNIGLHFYGRALEDTGRAAITGRPEDSGTFLTPSLRHVSRTGPYMHNGIVPELAGVIAIYNVGGPRPRPRPDQLDDPFFPTPSELLESLDLSPEERLALEAFLRAL